MFEAEYQALAQTGAGKSRLLKEKPAAYVISSMVAGMFISFGSFFAFTLGQGIAAGEVSSLTKLLQAFAFSSALSLIVMAGAELFTGNNLAMAAAAFRGKVSWADAAVLWAVCWVGNLAGSLLSVLFFWLTGVPTASDGAVAKYFTSVAAGKVSLNPGNLFFRAVLCNILVCLAVWCAAKMKSEAGKLIMVFWCILIFMVCGFEHSIANMSILGVALFAGGISPVSYCYSVLLATVGNMVGGIFFVALPYHILAKD